MCTLRERGGAGAPKYHGIVSYVSKLDVENMVSTDAQSLHLLLSVGWGSPTEGTPPTAPPHEGGERKKTEQKQDRVCKIPHIALPPNEILHSEELEGSTKTCRNSLKKNVEDGKKGRRMHKISNRLRPGHVGSTQSATA